MSCLGKGLKEKLANVPVGKDLFDGLTEKDRKQNEMMVNIALTIKKERNSRGLTQKEFAEFLHVKQTQISKWESGDHNFTIATLSDLADKLGLEWNLEFKRPDKGKMLPFPQNVHWQLEKSGIRRNVLEGA